MAGLSIGSSVFSFGNAIAAAKDFFHALFANEIKNRYKKMATSLGLFFIHTAQGVFPIAKAVLLKYVPGVSLLASAIDLSRRYRALNESLKLLADTKKDDQQNVTLINTLSEDVAKRRKAVGYGMFYVACSAMMLAPPLYWLGFSLGTAAWVRENKDAIRNAAKKTYEYVIPRAKVLLISVKERVTTVLAHIGNKLMNFFTRTNAPAAKIKMPTPVTVGLISPNHDDRFNAQASTSTIRRRIVSAGQNLRRVPSSRSVVASSQANSGTRAISGVLAIGRSPRYLSSQSFFANSSRIAISAATNGLAETIVPILPSTPRRAVK